MKEKTQKKFTIPFAAMVMPLALILGYVIFNFILGSPSNFEGGNNANQPLAENYLGVIYKGGSIVILLLAFIILVFTYAIERFIIIWKARGKENNQHFVRTIKVLLANKEIDNAIEACNQQKGSVANVIKDGLLVYQKIEKDETRTHDQKLIELQQELEEVTQLELPELNNNLIIISTLASISTLVGLLGTVTGMIKAFAALARLGAPDAVGLANGISQALVTTALGISSAAVAIVVYNYFSSRIDKITFSIDEASFSIIHTFKAQRGV